MTRTEVLELASRSKSISSYNARRPRFIYLETGTPKQPDSERYTKVAFADCVGIIEKIGICRGLSGLSHREFCSRALARRWRVR